MRAKLGLPDGADASALVEALLPQLVQSKVDHTSFYRALALAARGDAEPARGRFLDLAAFDAWLADWRALGPGRRRDGPRQPGPRPPQPPGGGGAGRGDRGRPRAAGAAARGGAVAVRRAAGLERYAEPGPVDVDYRTFCGT